MSAEKTDSDWGHLFPLFREKLRAVLAEAEAATGHKWILQEGFRSQERQTWLYAQGRTRPGPKITWVTKPLHHGAGLAADCYPTSNGKTPDFSIGRRAYELYREIYQKHGLGNGAWAKGDLGHVELIDAAIQAQAEAWVAAGFPDDEVPEPPTVTLNGQKVAAGDVRVFDGRTFLFVRTLEQIGAEVKWADGKTTISVPVK